AESEEGVIEMSATHPNHVWRQGIVFVESDDGIEGDADQLQSPVAGSLDPEAFRGAYCAPASPGQDRPVERRASQRDPGGVWSCVLLPTYPRAGRDGPYAHPADEPGTKNVVEGIIRRNRFHPAGEVVALLVFACLAQGHHPGDGFFPYPVPFP